MNKIITLTEETIQSIFGHEAAEDEKPQRLKEYYFKNDIYGRVTANVPLRILVGHKGIGKSALFKVAMLEDLEDGTLPILIKPDDIIDIEIDESDFLKSIRCWRNGLNKIICKKVLEHLGIYNDDYVSQLKTYGGRLVAFLFDSFSELNKKSVNYKPSQQKIIQQFLKSRIIKIYIDDLDRGWLSRKVDINRISALLNAVRDMCNDNQGLEFKISLRSDVYFLVRTSDESTDKIEGSVVWYSWTNHEILIMLVKRLLTYQDREVDEKKLRNMNQVQLAGYLTSVMVGRFAGHGSWRNIPIHRMLMSLIRKRPRDLVKLCTLAAREASRNQSDIIQTSHFSNVFEEYSQGRIQDTINEYKSELPEIERLVFGMKPTKKTLRTSDGYIYKTSELLIKVSNIIERGKFKFANGKIATNKELAGFLFKINFITARKRMEDGEIDRKYFEENRYLSNNFVDFGYDWEVHPAYRWSLQPDNIEDIYKKLEVSE